MRAHLALCLALLTPVLTWAEPAGSGPPSHLPLVRVEEYTREDGTRLLRLTFPLVAADPRRRGLSVQEAREVLEALRNAPAPLFLAESPSQVTLTTSFFPLEETSELQGLEGRIMDGLKEAAMGLASESFTETSVAQSKWYKALRASPQYKPEEMRAAALELFSSPHFVVSMVGALAVYGLAWAAPELFASKGLAMTVTIGLLLKYSYTELLIATHAFLSLYNEARQAGDEAALEGVARRFATTISAVGVRVFITFAGVRLGGALPKVPPGGIWSRVAPPRVALPSTGPAARVMDRFLSQVLANPMQGGAAAASAAVPAVGTRLFAADGSSVFMAVLANSEARARGAARKALRTTGACSDKKGNGYEEHHICTNKNDKSERNGGPWTPDFKKLFDKVGLDLQDDINIVFLLNHKGPHPEDYHDNVYDRLEGALRNCKGREDCRRKFEDMLDEIAAELCTPGSSLNRLATRRP